ncbi:MAG: Excisionase [Phenylobacterium sp.]|nr:Excisionase [Phenylobacterium sp.]
MTARKLLNGTAMTQSDPLPEAETGALSVDGFCARFGLKRTSTYGELKAGRLNAVKCGRRTLIPVAEAHRWFLALPTYRRAA